MAPQVEQWLENVLSLLLANSASGVKNPTAVEKSALKAFDIDRASLTGYGLDKKTQDRLYRSLFVYSTGIHDVIKQVSTTTSAANASTLRLRCWTVFTRILEFCEPDNTEMIVREMQKNQHQVIDQIMENYDGALSERDAQVNAMTKQLTLVQLQCESLDHQLTAMTTANETLTQSTTYSIDSLTAELERSDERKKQLASDLCALREKNTSLLEDLESTSASLEATRKELAIALDAKQLLDSKNTALNNKVNMFEKQKVADDNEKEKLRESLASRFSERQLLFQQYTSALDQLRVCREASTKQVTEIETLTSQRAVWEHDISPHVKQCVRSMTQEYWALGDAFAELHDAVAACDADSVAAGGSEVTFNSTEGVGDGEAGDDDLGEPSASAALSTDIDVRVDIDPSWRQLEPPEPQAQALNQHQQQVQREQACSGVPSALPRVELQARNIGQCLHRIPLPPESESVHDDASTVRRLYGEMQRQKHAAERRRTQLRQPMAPCTLAKFASEGEQMCCWVAPNAEITTESSATTSDGSNVRNNNHISSVLVAMQRNTAAAQQPVETLALRVRSLYNSHLELPMTRQRLQEANFAVACHRSMESVWKNLYLAEVGKFEAKCADLQTSEQLYAESEAALSELKKQYTSLDKCYNLKLTKHLELTKKCRLFEKDYAPLQIRYDETASKLKECMAELKGSRELCAEYKNEIEALKVIVAAQETSITEHERSNAVLQEDLERSRLDCEKRLEHILAYERLLHCLLRDINLHHERLSEAAVMFEGSFGGEAGGEAGGEGASSRQISSSTSALSAVDAAASAASRVASAHTASYGSPPQRVKGGGGGGGGGCSSSDSLSTAAGAAASPPAPSRTRLPFRAIGSGENEPEHDFPLNMVSSPVVERQEQQYELLMLSESVTYQAAMWKLLGLADTASREEAVGAVGVSLVGGNIEGMTFLANGVKKLSDRTTEARKHIAEDVRLAVKWAQSVSPYVAEIKQLKVEMNQYQVYFRRERMQMMHRFNAKLETQCELVESACKEKYQLRFQELLQTIERKDKIIATYKMSKKAEQHRLSDAFSVGDASGVTAGSPGGGRGSESDAGESENRTTAANAGATTAPALAKQGSGGVTGSGRSTLSEGPKVQEHGMFGGKVTVDVKPTQSHVETDSDKQEHEEGPAGFGDELESSSIAAEIIRGYMSRCESPTALTLADRGEEKVAAELAREAKADAMLLRSVTAGSGRSRAGSGSSSRRGSTASAGGTRRGSSSTSRPSRKSSIDCISGGAAVIASSASGEAGAAIDDSAAVAAVAVELGALSRSVSGVSALSAITDTSTSTPTHAVKDAPAPAQRDSSMLPVIANSKETSSHPSSRSRSTAPSLTSEPSISAVVSGGGDSTALENHDPQLSLRPSAPGSGAGTGSGSGSGSVPSSRRNSNRSLSRPSSADRSANANSTTNASTSEPTTGVGHDSDAISARDVLKEGIAATPAAPAVSEPKPIVAPAKTVQSALPAAPAPRRGKVATARLAASEEEAAQLEAKADAEVAAAAATVAHAAERRGDRNSFIAKHRSLVVSTCQSLGLSKVDSISAEGAGGEKVVGQLAVSAGPAMSAKVPAGVIVLPGSVADIKAQRRRRRQNAKQKRALLKKFKGFDDSDDEQEGGFGDSRADGGVDDDSEYDSDRDEDDMSDDASAGAGYGAGAEAEADTAVAETNLDGGNKT